MKDFATIGCLTICFSDRDEKFIATEYAPTNAYEKKYNDNPFYIIFNARPTGLRSENSIIVGKDHYSLFYSGYSPSGYSYCYSNDINGDGLAYDLMYIPRDDSEIKFASDDDRTRFWDFVEQDDYLKHHKGQYAEVYGGRAPWVHTVDFKWAHDFDVKVGNTKHKLQLIANVENIGNLLNSKWGVAKQIPGMSNNMFKLLSVANASDVKKGAQPIFRMNTDMTTTWDYTHSYGQCWRFQVGVKYYFN